MSSRFSAEQINELADIEEVDVETQQAGKPRRTTIWIVVVDGDAYVRSVKAEQGQWYQAFRASPNGALYVGDRRFAVRAVPVTDPDIIARVSDEYMRKYAASEWAPPMIEPDTLPTTLRLEPVQARP